MPQPLTKEKIEFSQLSTEHSVRLEDVKNAVRWYINKLRYYARKDHHDSGYYDYEILLIQEAFEGALENDPKEN